MYHVCKLLKSIYRLRQSPRASFHRLWDFLLAMNFIESISDQSLFICITNEVTTYLLVYVDDIILTSSLEKFITTIINQLGKEFALKDLGPLSYFLGIHIAKLLEGELFVSQQQYLGNLLHNLGLSNLKPAKTLMEAKADFDKGEVLSEADRTKYR